MNLASRITALARAGSVLATREVRDAADDATVLWSAAGERRVRGVPEPVSLSPRAPRARRRRNAAVSGFAGLQCALAARLGSPGRAVRTPVWVRRYEEGLNLMHHHRRGRLPAALLAVLMLGAIGASSALADNYVALGDSYSSGTGTRDYSLNSGCQRGPYAYPYLIKQHRPNTTLNFVACSGAKTGDVLANQVSAVNSSTNIVTITIGGNDAGFSDVITECAKPSWAVQLRRPRDDGAELHPQHAAGPAQQRVLADQVARRGDGQGGRARLPAHLQRRGLQRRDVLQPRRRDTAERDRRPALEHHVGRAAAYGFTFKSAIPSFIGHAVCDNPEWLNGLSNPIGDSYHPNRSGHSLGYEPLVRAVIG